MRNARLLIFGIATILSGVGLAQDAIEVGRLGQGVVRDAQVQVFAAENNHTLDVLGIPMPREKAVWEGRTNELGRVEIPQRFGDGRRGLVWVKKDDLHGFAILGGKNPKAVLSRAIALRKYRTMKIVARDRSGKPVPNIPVYMVDAIKLSIHHLS